MNIYQATNPCTTALSAKKCLLRYARLLHTSPRWKGDVCCSRLQLGLNSGRTDGTVSIKCRKDTSARVWWKHRQPSSGDPGAFRCHPKVAMSSIREAPAAFRSSAASSSSTSTSYFRSLDAVEPVSGAFWNSSSRLSHWTSSCRDLHTTQSTLRTDDAVRVDAASDAENGDGPAVHAAVVQQPAEKNGEGVTVETKQKKRVVSGVQPTGSIHLGNYLGAIKNWVSMQDEFDALFFVVDLHAITVPHVIGDLAPASRNSAAMYIACGINPDKTPIFVQSHIRAHAEMTWLLSCICPISWLNKMIQFKEKARKQGEDVGTGLLTYPLLMASDILLYQSDVVPVGEDQRQHLELARDLAARVNHIYGGRKWKKRGGPGGRIFKEPGVLVPPAGARVMSLTDGTCKMSKSAASDLSRINLLDPPDLIQSKIKKCKTDAFVGMELRNPDRPECTNLLSIYQVITAKTEEEVLSECKSLTWGQFKPLLADAVVEHLRPIQERYEEIVKDPKYLDDVLSRGAATANEIADGTVDRLYDAMGFLRPKASSNR